MALILNIDTASVIASICLSKDGTVVSFYKNESQKDHAGWLHPAIEKAMKDSGYTLQFLDAVAVTIGPGSYTGLRIGLAAAKGLCYTLKKPLIALNTLQVMAQAVRQEAEDMICPMIDARRNEVFAAIYNRQLEPVMEPAALILDENSFSQELKSHHLLFSGGGSIKFKQICTSPNAHFTDTPAYASDMTGLSEDKWVHRVFSDPAYSEPLYLKEFFTAGPKPLI